MPLYSFTDLIQPALQGFWSRIEAALAGRGWPADRAHVIDFCRDLACLVYDPHGVELANFPGPHEAYAHIATEFEAIAATFPELLDAFRAFLAEREQDPQLQACVQAAIDAGALPPCDVRRKVRLWSLQEVTDT
jgi:hypothetical protein